MGLADAIDEQRARPRGRMLELDKIRAQLDDDDRQVLDAALADASLPAARLAKALEAEGHKISESAIYAYRRRYVAR